MSRVRAGPASPRRGTITGSEQGKGSRFKPGLAFAHRLEALYGLVVDANEELPARAGVDDAQVIALVRVVFIAPAKLTQLQGGEVGVQARHIRFRRVLQDVERRVVAAEDYLGSGPAAVGQGDLAEAHEQQKGRDADGKHPGALHAGLHNVF